MRLTFAAIALIAGSAIASPAVANPPYPMIRPRQAANVSTTQSATGTLSGYQSSLTGTLPSSTSTATSLSYTSSESAITSNSTVGTTSSTFGQNATQSVTLYEDENKNFKTTPAITYPSSGCAIVTQAPSTFIETFTSVTTDSITFTSGLYCECSGGTIAGTSVSTNSYGTEYIYCATGGSATASSDAAATATPSSIPGSANNPDWYDVSCSYGSLTSITNNPWSQWNDSGATAAWNDMVDAWNDPGADQSIGLSNFIANFFNAPPNYNCEDLGDQYCTTVLNCGSHLEANAAVNSPAGYIIMNSLVNVHGVLDNFYSNVEAAISLVDAGIGEFVSTYSTVNQVIAAELREEVILDDVALALGALYGFAFGSWLKQIEWIADNPNYLSVASNVISSETTSAFTRIKQSLQTTSTLPEQNSIADYVGVVGNTWLNSTQAIATGLFNSTDDLFNLINQGLMFTDDPDTTAISSTDTLAEALFANALPQVWTAGASVSQPFILTSANLTTTSSGECEGYSPFTGDFAIATPRGMAYSSSSMNSDACITYNGGAYWMVTAKMATASRGRCEIDCTPEGIIEVETPYDLSGLSSPQTDYYGLDAQLVLENAVNTWITNGYANIESTGDPTDISSIEAFDSADLTSITNLVSIPVCSFDEAGTEVWENQYNTLANPFWPCPSGVAEGSQT